MITRKKVIELLVRQGVSELAPEALIMGTLMKSGMSENEARQGITALHQVGKSFMDSMSGAQRLFYSDNKLSPQNVSELLNISLMTHPHAQYVDYTPSQNKGYSESLVAVVTVIVGLLIAVIAVVASMYYFQIGPFYELASP